MNIINDVKRITKKLYLFAHINKLEREKTGIRSLIESFKDQKVNHPFYDNIELICKKNISTNDIEVSLDRTQFKSAFENLLNNALEAIDENGFVKIEIIEDNEAIVLKMRNTLLNSDLNIDKVLERRFTTKESFGLGIPIAKNIIEKHGGTFEIKKTEKEFIVKILLPAKHTK